MNTTAYKDISDLIDPALLHSVDGLSLVGRLLVEEYFSGSHRSLRLGQGMEFSQYRPYEPGDDLRLLDWKLVARKNHYFIRQSELESGASIQFILDSSASMNHEFNGLSKLNFSKVLISALAYLASQQGDAIGLYAAQGLHQWSLPPARKGHQYYGLLHTLIDVNAEDQWVDHTIRNHLGKSIILFITDMYEVNDELISSLKSLNGPNADIAVLQITEPQEWALPPGKALVVEDLETGEQVHINPDGQGDHYTHQWNAFIKETADTLHENHIHHQVVRMDQPLHETIKFFLDRKARHQL